MFYQIIGALATTVLLWAITATFGLSIALGVCGGLFIASTVCVVAIGK